MKFFVASILGALTLLGAAQAADVKVSAFSPAAVPVGERFVVDLFVSGLDVEDLAAFEVELAFDPVRLGYVGATLGIELTDPIFGQEGTAAPSGPGAATLAETSWLADFSAQPSAFKLGSIELEGLLAGTSQLVFGYTLLSDPAGNPIAADAIGARVRVPTPATAALLAPLALLPLVRRRASPKAGG